jgi:hypothetical protein
MSKPKQPKLQTLRPGEATVGLQVLSTICANNLAPTQFTIRKLEQPTEDAYRPGEQLQMVELIDSRGFGGWETLWSRPEVSGPVFHNPV